MMSGDGSVRQEYLAVGMSANINGAIGKLELVDYFAILFTTSLIVSLAFGTGL